MNERQGVDTERERSQSGAMLHATRPLESAAPVTWEDFVHLPDDDRRELIDGALVEVEVPTFLHEFIVALLVHRLTGWALEHGAVVLASGYRVRVRGDIGFMPDVQLYRSRARVTRPEAAQGLEDGAPDLAIEVISPTSGRHDRVTKFNGYAAIGVTEYWLVDPQARLLEQFVLDGEHYRLEARLADDALFEPKTLPGLSLPLATLWDLPADEAAEEKPSGG